ncbi:hypothetical protein CC1G_10269 [Coprinopsis cinerea okayama7|uniref:Uncharacterized protein n=1 Tax=Coprinopsis cinerea (strain Okayama-7 / 130 / ATCC MYA-4618 / FGSC 9003) TaxID=240176 RepID=A8N148_COPC7|nr:hypothetical protein CC1G_10269 [Coprinopsis cinerea okayama7\|eukprot:XP_001828598.2 hypothetical protein CC1G_10269 [Coprinopsis cinerea okayama7\
MIPTSANANPSTPPSSLQRRRYDCHTSPIVDRYLGRVSSSGSRLPSTSPRHHPTRGKSQTQRLKNSFPDDVFIEGCSTSPLSSSSLSPFTSHIPWSSASPTNSASTFPSASSSTSSSPSRGRLSAAEVERRFLRDSLARNDQLPATPQKSLKASKSERAQRVLEPQAGFDSLFGARGRTIYGTFGGDGGLGHGGSIASSSTASSCSSPSSSLPLPSTPPRRSSNTNRRWNPYPTPTSTSKRHRAEASPERSACVTPPPLQYADTFKEEGVTSPGLPASPGGSSDSSSDEEEEPTPIVTKEPEVKVVDETECPPGCVCTGCTLVGELFSSFIDVTQCDEEWWKV